MLLHSACFASSPVRDSQDRCRCTALALSEQGIGQRLPGMRVWCATSTVYMTEAAGRSETSEAGGMLPLAQHDRQGGTRLGAATGSPSFKPAPEAQVCRDEAKGPLGACSRCHAGQPAPVGNAAVGEQCSSHQDFRQRRQRLWAARRITDPRRKALRTLLRPRPCQSC